MAGAKEIRTKIASVKSTQKITSAMEMVAASKMRKAQDRMEATRPYADKMRQVIGHVALANPGVQASFHACPSGQTYRLHHHLVRPRSVRWSEQQPVPAAWCREIKALHESGTEVEFCTIGTKALGFFRRVGGKVIGPGHAPGRCAAYRRSGRYRQGDAGCVRER